MIILLTYRLLPAYVEQISKDTCFLMINNEKSY